MINTDYDVIIAGSGPAGSTAATLLAQKKHRVLVLERDQHPRFHIGESMLPMSTPVFNRLGIQWDAQAYLHKNGAEFIDEQSAMKVRFCLNSQHQPYQVERAQFDQMLIENAVQQGALLHQQEAVKTVEVNDVGVQVATDRNHYSSRYFIDATGRDVFMGKQNASIERIENLGQFALYTHYKNCVSEAAQKMYVSGDIKVLMVDVGWVWIIPLVGNRLSIGVVIKERLDKSLRGEELFNKYVNESEVLDELLEGAVREKSVRSEADFSFSNTQRYGKRFSCCGDAAGFLDPIFSSGVFLAVTSAERVVDRLHQALIAQSEDNPNLHREDDKEYHLGFRSMRLFVERFYRYDMVHHLFFEADRNEQIKNDIASLLSGDLWREGNEFQRMLLQGRQSQCQ